MSLGENIRKARKAKGWSQKELADQIGSDGSYMNRIETGKANPSVAVLERIANALGASLDELVRGQDGELRIENAGLVERVRLIDKLREDDRTALTHIIDLMLTRNRMRDLLEGRAAGEAR